jgi:hypothetical protein
MGGEASGEETTPQGLIAKSTIENSHAVALNGIGV